jgi:hypothetical protein
MDEIFQSTLKTVMFIILVALEIPSAITLVWMWLKDCKEAKERKKEQDDFIRWRNP